MIVPQVLVGPPIWGLDQEINLSLHIIRAPCKPNHDVVG